MFIQDKMKIMMEQRNWSCYKLAKVADLPESTIKSVFSRNSSLSYYTLEAICKAFGMTTAQFLTDEGDPVVLTETQKEILSKWFTLTHGQQEALLKFIDTLIFEEK